MKKGFTLVELSIVLVIIGLLIGGILVAQSMIGTAKIQSQVRQFQQFDILVENFRTKFNSIPGDSRLFATNGNGDGIIDSTGNGMVWDGESAISGSIFQIADSVLTEKHLPILQQVVRSQKIIYLKPYLKMAVLVRADTVLTTHIIWLGSLKVQTVGIIHFRI